MTEVSLIGWRIGLKKIPLDLLIKDRASLSLSQAKRSVDELLDGKTVVLSFDNPEDAVRFSEDASALGAICDYVAG